MRELMHSDGRRPRVLLSAYACEPVKGSEPGVGWNWVRQISQFAEVWVLTRANNRGSIEAALAAQALPHVHFVYYDLPRWMSFWKSRSRGVHAYYYLWQIGAYFAARNFHRDSSFDLIHHATFASCWFPSFMAFLPAPFVWGPLGGGESTPHSFWQSFSVRGKVYEFFRSLSAWKGRCDPFVRATARRAAFAIATTPETEKQLRALGCANTAVLSLAAIGDEEFEMLARFPERTSGPFRVFSTGRLLHWKGFHLGIAAFARFHHTNPKSEYWLIGDGPERQRLEKLACDLSVAEHVHFCGELPRAEALQKIAACDVMVQPSLHDSSGWASIEAMAAGRAVICLDAGGLALQVDEGNGVKIPAVSPSQAVDAIAVALESLARNLELRLQYGRAGRARVAAEFNWARKAQEIRRIYDRVLTRSPLIVPRAGELQGHANEFEVPAYRDDTF
jgi:glycosyltransferase involved in cell wall biosynthesis